MHGQGIYILPDQLERYEGHFKNNLRHGHGVYSYKNGNRHTGVWVDGRREGQGTHRYKETSEEYKGMWKDGLRHGQGHYTHFNGDVY